MYTMPLWTWLCSGASGPTGVLRALPGVHACSSLVSLRFCPKAFAYLRKCADNGHAHRC